MTNAFAIKTDFVGTTVSEMSRTIAFVASWSLTVVSKKNLKFPKTQEARDRFVNPNTVISETIVDTGSIRMLASSVI